MIEYRCPGCGRAMRASDDMAGRPGRCKGCGRVAPVPAAGPPSPAGPTLTCPRCRAAFQASGPLAPGQTVACPVCQAPLEAPGAAPSAAPAAPAPSAPPTPARPGNWAKVRWGLTLLKLGTVVATAGAAVLIFLVLMVNWAALLGSEVNQTYVLLPLGMAGLSTLLVGYLLLLIGDGLALALPPGVHLRKLPLAALGLSLLAALLMLGAVGVAGFHLALAAAGHEVAPVLPVLLTGGLAFAALLAWTGRHVCWLLLMRRLGQLFHSRHVPDMALTQVIASMTFALGSFLFCCGLPIGHAVAVGGWVYQPPEGTTGESTAYLAQVRSVLRDVGVVTSLIAALWVAILITLVILFFNLISEVQDAFERGSER